MGTCQTKPSEVYIVKENQKTICCTYDYKKADTFFQEPRVPNRELQMYYPDTSDNTMYCLKHTYGVL